MGNFNDRGRGDRGGFRGGDRGGRPNFGGNRGGNRGGDRREVEMHKAICDNCHKSCEVPFRPSGDKPIYCNECFAGKRDGGDRGGRKDFGSNKPRRDFNDKKQSFSQNSGSGVSEDLKKQLGEMNSKLDRLINAIESLSAPKVSAPKTKEVKETKVVKAPAKKVAVKAPAKKVVAKKKK